MVPTSHHGWYKGAVQAPFFMRGNHATTQSKRTQAREKVQQVRQTDQGNQYAQNNHARRNPPLMACSSPLQAYRPATGGALLFNPPTNGRAYSPIHVPCGYCLPCREEYARQTAIRIYHESQLHEQNAFVTLSYNDDNLPEHNSLQYADLARFHKRLRHHLGGKLRHYSVGEYGDKSLRPHYHMCVFGNAFLENRIIVRHTPTLLWTTAFLEQCWGHGFISVGTLNYTTASYTASYVTKKLRAKQKYVRVDETTGELLELEQPKAIMSPNLGKEWWLKYGHQVADHDYVIINGKRQKPPKAYDRWLGEVNKTKLEQIKENRKEHAIKLTEEEAHARAKNAHAREEQKRRNKSL